MKTSVIEVQDMLSVLSVLGVEKRIGEVPGVESVTVNYAAESATVRYDETRLEVADIKSAVRQIGYESEGETGMSKTLGEVPPSTSEEKVKIETKNKSNTNGSKSVTPPIRAAVEPTAEKPKEEIPASTPIAESPKEKVEAETQPPVTNAKKKVTDAPPSTDKPITEQPEAEAPPTLPIVESVIEQPKAKAPPMPVDGKPVEEESKAKPLQRRQLTNHRRKKQRLKPSYRRTKQSRKITPVTRWMKCRRTKRR